MQQPQQNDGVSVRDPIIDASPRSATARRDRPRMRYEPGLDGLRAISVIAVILYHAGAGWLPGGFLGVEVFFVVSGYLITALLVEEWGRNDGIDLRAFYVRRARRLLPALYAMMLATAIYASLFAPDTLRQLRADLIAGLLYVANWWFIHAKQSYFDQLGRPPLMRHLWSLAVEEQWYFLWPLAFRYLMRRVGGEARRLAMPLVGFAFASSVLMWWWYSPDDPSRAYYGTDARASGLLLGAALAVVWMPWRWPNAGTKELHFVELVGVLAIGGLVIAMLGFDELGRFFHSSGSPLYTRGGYLFVGVLSALAIAVVVHPGARRLRRVVGSPALQAVGRRSYGLYLWHWPVFQVLRHPEDTPLAGPFLLIARLTLTIVLSELCYRYVEQPIRSGGLSRWWAGLRRFQLASIVPLLGALACTVILGGALVLRLSKAEKIDIFRQAGGDTSAAAAAPTDPGGAGSTAADGSTTDASAGGDGGAASPTTVPGPPPLSVVLVGDSQATALVANAPSSLASTMSLSNGGVEGCGVLDEGRLLTVALTNRPLAGCVGWADKWAASVRKVQAKVALVVIGAWDVFDVARPAGVLAVGTPAHDAVWKAGLQKGIDALKGQGAKVALLEIPCYRPIAAGGLPKLPERGEDRRGAHLNDLMRQVAAADPANVTFLAGPPEWCADPTIAEDRNERWDGVHYYRPGALRVFNAVKDQLVALGGAAASAASSAAGSTSTVPIVAMST